MLNLQCREPNRTTMARTLNLALLFGHPILICQYYDNQRPDETAECILILSWEFQSQEPQNGQCLGKES